MDAVLTGEVPTLVEEELTRQFEDEMELIRQEKSSPEKVLNSAKEKLMKILTDIKKNEIELGKKLADASKLARFEAAKIAKCPSCSEGTLVLKTARKTRRKFIACDKYPECKTIFNAPQVDYIRGLDEDATDENGKIWFLAGKSQGNFRKVCLNPDVPEEEEKGEKKYEEEGMTCPNCNEGEMVLRKSFYGEFLGCNNYPKCKTMMQIKNGEVNTTPISPAAKKKTTKKSTKKTTKKTPSS
jgi:DNA topoisomerase-1